MPHPSKPRPSHPQESLEARLRGAGLLMPPILHERDVAVALHLKTASAGRRAIVRGDAGPFIRQGRRLYVLRSTFLEHLQSLAITAQEATLSPGAEAAERVLPLGSGGPGRDPAERRPAVGRP